MSDVKITIGPITYASDKIHFDALAGVAREATLPLLTEIYGKRCEEFDEDCLCCQKWKALDFLLENPFDD